MIANLTTQRNAIKMLSERVAVIVQYLNAVAEGTAPKDQETLRMISALCTSLPATDSLDYREEFMTASRQILSRAVAKGIYHELILGPARLILRNTTTCS